MVGILPFGIRLEGEDFFTHADTGHKKQPSSKLSLLNSCL